MAAGVCGCATGAGFLMTSTIVTSVARNIAILMMCLSFRFIGNSQFSEAWVGSPADMVLTGEKKIR